MTQSSSDTYIFLGWMSHLHNETHAPPPPRPLKEAFEVTRNTTATCINIPHCVGCTGKTIIAQKLLCYSLHMYNL